MKKGQKLKLLSSLVEKVSDSILVTDVDHKIIYMNKASEKLFGYTFKELKGKTPGILNADSHSKKIQQEIYRTVSAGKNYFGSFLNKRKDGSTFICEFKVTPLSNNKEKVYAYVGIQRNMTEREKDKEAPKKSEEKFRTLMEASPFSIQGYGTDGTVHHWNKASEKAYGYTAKEAIGKYLGELIIPPDIKPLFKKALQIGKKAKKSGEFMPAGEVSLLKKDGSSIDVYSTHMVVKTEDGESEMFCIDVDLSERKKMEEELRKLKLGIERSDQAIFTTDKKGTITYVNPTFEKLYGYKSKYALGRHRRLINSRKQTKRFYDNFWKELLEGKTMNVELITKSKNGLHINVMESVNTIINNEGKIIGFLSIQTNITENKKVQEQLIEAEEKYRDIVENSPAMVHSVDKNGRIIFANQKECETLGYTLEELTGMHIKKIYSAKLWQDVQKGFEQLKKKGSLFIGDGEVVKKNGETIDVEIDSIALYSRKGKFMHTRSIIRDVTERKRTECALIQSQKRLIEAQQIAHVGNWDWDIIENTLWWSDEIYRIFGLKPQQFGATYEAFSASVHPDDRKHVANKVKEALKKNNYNIDHRIILPDGKVHHVHEQANVFYDKNKKSIRMVGTIQDITERKQAESETLQQKERFQTLFNSSRDAIMTLEPPTWMFTSGNPATIKMFACKDENNFVSRGLWQYSPPKQPDGQPSLKKAKAMIMKAMKEGSNFFEWTHRRLTGEDFPSTVLLTRMTVNNKIFLQATVRDITLQKEAQQALEKAHDELEKRVEERTVELKEAKDKLQEKVTDLERFANIAVGRELRMIELKKRIKDLEKAKK